MSLNTRMNGVFSKMVRGILLIFVLGFLFQCGKSDDSVKDGDSADDGPAKGNGPSLVTLELSTPEVTFSDVDGATGATYMISASRLPAAEKTVEVTLTSTNPLLVVSPTVVRFTSMDARPQTITVKRAGDAVDIITTDITGTIEHAITTDTEFAEFAMMGSMVNVTVTSTPTPSNVRLSTPEVTFNDVDGAMGATYMISVSRPPAAEKTVEVTLASTNPLLVVSPTVVRFTSMNAHPQTITVKRAGDAVDIITTDITGTIEHAITTGAEFAEFAMMKSMVNVTVRTTFVADADGDGLIDISTAEMLNNMQYDLAGTSYKTSAMDAGSGAGCPAGGCNGYELMANINLLPLLDANGNGMIDTITKNVAGKDHTVIDVGSDKDKSWSPVGDDADPFTGTFEGNGNTIANLWVNIPGGYAGLFGATAGSAEIRNVGVISGGVFSSSTSAFSSSSGGLVGEASSGMVGPSSSLTITNSYFRGEGGISHSTSAFSSSATAGGLVGSSSSSLTITDSYFSGSGSVTSSSLASSTSTTTGGLVGSSSSSLTITNSYFSGSDGVSSSSSSLSSSGGLVGSSSSSSTITNSYFSSSGGVSSSALSSSFSGGLVGSSSDSSLMITNSYFSGSDGVSSSSSAVAYSGGLVGRSNDTLMITNSYFSGSDGVSSSGFLFSSGGLVGSSSGDSAVLAFVNSYWNTDAPQLTDDGMTAQAPKRAQGDVTADPMGAVGLTLTQLKATSGTYPNLLGNAWDLGTDQQNPAVKQCILDMAGTGCASPAMYGDLLDGQR